MTRLTLPRALRRAAFVLAALLAGSALADVAPLSPEEVKRLNDVARPFYDQALAAWDRIDRVGAVEALERASQAQPGHLELAFLVADVAQLMGRRAYSQETLKGRGTDKTSEFFFQMGLNAIDRVSRHPDLDAATTRRAEDRREALTLERQALIERDSRRISTGQKVNREVADMLGLEPEVVTGKPRPKLADPRQPFNFRILGQNSVAAAAPAPGIRSNLPTGMPMNTASPAAATGANPFETTPTTTATTTGTDTSTTAASTPAAASPFDAPGSAPAALPFTGASADNPFGAPAALPTVGTSTPGSTPADPAATGASPFGAPPPAAPAPTDPSASPFAPSTPAADPAAPASPFGGPPPAAPVGGIVPPPPTDAANPFGGASANPFGAPAASPVVGAPSATPVPTTP